MKNMKIDRIVGKMARWILIAAFVISLNSMTAAAFSCDGQPWTTTLICALDGHEMVFRSDSGNAMCEGYSCSSYGSEFMCTFVSGHRARGVNHSSQCELVSETRRHHTHTSACFSSASIDIESGVASSQTGSRLYVVLNGGHTRGTQYFIEKQYDGAGWSQFTNGSLDFRGRCWFEFGPESPGTYSVKYRIHFEEEGIISGYNESPLYIVEHPNYPPTISGYDGSIGTNIQNQNYSVNDTDLSDSLTVTEKLDGNIIRTITSAVRNSTYSIYVNPQSLSLGAHSISVTVTDGKGGAATRTWSFTVSCTCNYTLLFDSQLFPM